MKCKQVKEIIINSRRSEASGIHDAEITEHVKICPQCRVIFEENERLDKIMKKYPAWTPSDVYWNSLLPRIHLRLGKKREPVVPQWMYRSLAPAAAALLIIVLSIYIFRFNGNRDLLPTGITDNDIANYIEQETIVNLYVTNGIGTADTIGSDDAIVIYDLLKNENNVASYYEDRAGSLLETVNENEAEKLFALLSDDFKNHK